MPLSEERIAKRGAAVAIIGLGYVGLPLAIRFCEGGLRVVGIDLDEQKIDQLASGQSYLQAVTSQRVAAALKSGHLSLSSAVDPVSAVDAVILCLPTPLTEQLEPDLSYITSTCEAIAPHLAPHTLISLESTTWPGTTEEVVRALLEKRGPLYFAFSPEREDPGNRDFSTAKIPKLVGGSDETSLRLAAALYRVAVEEVVEVSSTRVAEAAKLLENIFRSVNIALVNELKVIFHKMGIDIWEVIAAASTKPFGFMPFWPGPGLGGHCIPIDPFYLSWKAKEFGITTRFIELAGEINRSMPYFVVSQVQDRLNEEGLALKGARILVLGLTYKADVADLRESPSLKIIDLLQQKGARVEYNDPFFGEIPRTREYSSLMGMRSCAISREFDLFILSAAHTSYSREGILRCGVPIVDTRNFFPKHELVWRA